MSELCVCVIGDAECAAGRAVCGTSSAGGGCVKEGCTEQPCSGQLATGLSVCLTEALSLP